jgi:hypothetical protein
MFKLGTPPNNTEATSFAFKKWFQDIYTWSKGGVLVPNGGYLPEQSSVVSLAGSERNLLLNGAFNIWQRGASINNTAAATNYTADRWATTRPTATTVTVAQTASSLIGIPFCARISRAAADTTTDTIYLAQALETNDCIRLQNQYVTLSFWARAGSGFSGSVISGTGTFGAFITSGTGVDQGPFTVFVGAASVLSKVVVPNTTWTYYEVTGKIPNNSNQIKVFFQWTPTATAGANNYMDITGVQLEIGQQATPFESLEFGRELERCCRYYHKSFTYSLTPAQNTASNLGVHAYPCTVAGAATNYSPSIYLPVTMRRAPTITYYNPQAANAFVFNFTRGTSATATANAGTTGLRAFNTSCTGVLGWAVGDLLGFHWQADAEL